jgi:hypothetical protein
MRLLVYEPTCVLGLRLGASGVLGARSSGSTCATCSSARHVAPQAPAWYARLAWCMHIETLYACYLSVRMLLYTLSKCGHARICTWLCGRFKKIYVGKSQLHTQHIPRGITGYFLIYKLIYTDIYIYMYMYIYIYSIILYLLQAILTWWLAACFSTSLRIAYCILLCFLLY